MNNHVLNPTFFYPAIELFSFNYTAFIKNGQTLDEEGNRHDRFQQVTIRGSLQSQGSRKQYKTDGNSYEKSYRFYCKSLYRIDKDDFIRYKHQWLKVTDVTDIDEYGCRECSLSEVMITGYKDLDEYNDYIEGVELV